MIDIKTRNEDLVLTVPKYFFNNKNFQNLLACLEIEKALENSTLTEQQAWDLSEEVKQNWWTKNGGKFLAGDQ